MSAWEAACRQHIEYAEDWDLSLRQNRRELARWKRRLWWARFGGIISGVVGCAFGIAITQLVLHLTGWLS